MTNAPQSPQYPEYPQNPQGGNKYGTAGYDPNQNFELTKPPQVDRLFQLTMASFVLYLISSVVGIVALFSDSTREVIREELESQGVASGAELDQFVNAGLIGGAVVMVIPLVIAIAGYALVLLGIKKRWGWSRILGIVLAILGTLFTAYGLRPTPEVTAAGGMYAVNLILGLLFIAVNVYWLVLAFNGKVAAWLGRRG
ncbi:hypothetical protein FCK90_07280 [Kocuria coralli]|uniref:Uncharacterized protein n=1 Tax=Kocuria coralli TaxID=1461025 RepID=A0A5J5KZR8_9MICC|nr:hypothetical protein [Kocuria coralli]KAA9394276.1 hypothetical protein FCK90_07280 [Kocuria coralli]